MKKVINFILSFFIKDPHLIDWNKPVDQRLSIALWIIYPIVSLYACFHNIETEQCTPTMYTYNVQAKGFYIKNYNLEFEISRGKKSFTCRGYISYSNPY